MHPKQIDRVEFRTAMFKRFLDEKINETLVEPSKIEKLIGMAPKHLKDRITTGD